MKAMSATKVKKSEPEKTTSKVDLPDPDTLETMVNIFKSLADKNRLTILFTLASRGRMHVSAICDQLKQSQPAVSHHLTQLRTAKLVNYNRDGKYNFYELDSRVLNHLVDLFFPNATSAQQKITFGDLELLFKKK